MNKHIFVKLIILLIFFIFIVCTPFYFFMSANNGIIHDAGLKDEYLSLLPKKYVIPFKVITQDNQKNIVNNLDYPVVFKPNDCSGSGANVEKIENEEQAYKYLNKIKGAYKKIIAQKCSDLKNEFSVLYERYPMLNKGKVVAITEKVPLDKTKNFDVLNVGTGLNNRKCNVIDCSDKITEQFSILIDNITKKVPNLYAGRYDVKAKNIEELLKGNFGIMELNNLLGVDHRSYVDTMVEFDKNNYHLQLRWLFKRILLGIQNNMIENPLQIMYRIVYQIRTMCESEYKTLLDGLKTVMK